MRLKILLAFLLFLNYFFTQEDVCIFSKDKPDAPTFFANPLLELSQRSLDKRKVQGILLDNKDGFYSSTVC
ncbi:MULTISPECIES: hypothetical protein [Flavobacterium]|uniref:Uncharacterized protein n=1 Tax=Flavobacterium columnare TaxID=996 RepID=A0AA94JNU7_9FLAO|nr:MULTISPECIES: hypothetical protein [Flavobacterium]AMA48714.1 hypothetical protein AWN65_04165 [Flavobacterium covae]AND65150.1 hypothetical protein AX766_12545 [Flavobacterium covae]MCH4830668.1 hypothetical protein [Flavobacterium columnare]MCH4833395.1 hypothetical protein [Flavobacterium columnare]MCJ1809647.1 hypothetical protein [Flavobacterium covae]